MKYLDILNRVIQVLSAMFLAVMTILVLVQVFFRYVLGNPLGTTQELSIYCMAWVIMLGASVAIRHGTHISVSFFVDRLPPALNKAARWLGYLLIVGFFVILCKEGWTLTQRAMLQMSPSSGLPVGWIVLAIPLCSAISILYVVEQIIRDVRRTKDTQASQS